MGMILQGDRLIKLFSSWILIFSKEQGHFIDAILHKLYFWKKNFKLKMLGATCPSPFTPRCLPIPSLHLVTSPCL